MRPNRWIALIVAALLIAGCVPVPTAPPPVEALPVMTVEPTAAPTATAEPTVAPTAAPAATPAPAAEPASLTAEEILALNREAEAALETMRMTMDMQVEAAGQMMTATMETLIENPDKAYAVSEAMGERTETLTLDGGETVFMRPAGSETWIKMAGEEAGETPQTGLDIDELALSPVLVGEETIDGVETYVVAFDVDLGQLLESDPMVAELFNPLTTVATGKMWIGKEDMLARKVVMEMAMALTVEGEEFGMSMLIEMAAGDFNQPVTFPEPSPYVEQE